MKVLYDHQTFSTQRYGGISRYFFNLYQYINQRVGNSAAIASLYSYNEYIKAINVPMNNALGRKIFTGHQNRIYRWNRRYSTRKLKQGNFDVFHPTYYDPYFLDDLKKPFVLTVHDMIHEVMADQFTDNNNVIAQKKLLIDRANAVIAISNHTKNEILKFYPDAAAKITVIHHGFEPATPTTVSNLNLPDKYLFFVGERYFYKNFVGMVKAIAPLLNNDSSLQLLCTGGGEFKADELRLFNELGISGQCRQINANDADLQQLYRQAALFIFPSFAEGFGFPLLEAFTAGCPVAASDNSCFPEIGGDAVVYFDPYDAQSMASAVNNVLTDGALRDRLITKGTERVTQFTMDKCVKETVALYNKVTGK